eukprot:TRINITY_DN32983_c0_g1_i1.p1 TRINITY_DN32983_c0_g1~~TRINITY_DN32983_c0_g1_i1.p1  ORF type:complete len:418 (-),score=82.74 TRINITY_DN32983_c0_g1_i1:19-1230(-)
MAAAAGRHELRLEVLQVANLAPAEYRFGDFTSGLMQGLSAGYRAGPSNIYIELTLASRTVRTADAQITPGTGDAQFWDERLLFAYSGEKELKLQVKDRRSVQAVLRGDPLVGEASLELGPDLLDGAPRSQVVDLHRGSSQVGAVMLQYQLALRPECSGLSSSTGPSAGDLAQRESNPQHAPPRASFGSEVDAEPRRTGGLEIDAEVRCLEGEEADGDSFQTPPDSPREQEPGTADAEKSQTGSAPAQASQAPAASSGSTVPLWVGTWKLDKARSEPYAPILSSIGVNFFLRKAADMANSTMTINISETHVKYRVDVFVTVEEELPIDGAPVEVQLPAGSRMSGACLRRLTQCTERVLEMLTDFPDGEGQLLDTLTVSEDGNTFERKVVRGELQVSRVFTREKQ